MHFVNLVTTPVSSVNHSQSSNIIIIKIINLLLILLVRGFTQSRPLRTVRNYLSCPPEKDQWCCNGPRQCGCSKTFCLLTGCNVLFHSEKRITPKVSINNFSWVLVLVKGWNRNKRMEKEGDTFLPKQETWDGPCAEQRKNARVINT